jgi:hypothetical protein
MRVGLDKGRVLDTAQVPCNGKSPISFVLHASSGLSDKLDGESMGKPRPIVQRDM